MSYCQVSVNLLSKVSFLFPFLRQMYLYICNIIILPLNIVTSEPLLCKGMNWPSSSKPWNIIFISKYFACKNSCQGIFWRFWHMQYWDHTPPTNSESKKQHLSSSCNPAVCYMGGYFVLRNLWKSSMNKFDDHFSVIDLLNVSVNTWPMSNRAYKNMCFSYKQMIWF